MGGTVQMRMYELRVRQAINKLAKEGVSDKIHHFRMHVDQHMLLMNDDIIYASVVTWGNQDFDMLLSQPTTLAGKPIVIDEDMDMDCINIEDENNHILLKIEGLPIIQPFQK
jgi:hypothetical protein